MQTEAQRKAKNDICISLYLAVAAFIAQFGYAPNYREMCQLTGIKTTSLVRGYLDVLKTWQWIQIDERKARSLRLIRPTEIHVPENIRKQAVAKADQLHEQWLAAEATQA